MRPVFLKDLSNVSRFLAGTQRVKESGAVEACWQLVEGDPGYGKSAMLEWWATQGDHVYLRAKSGWTYNWALKELVKSIGFQPIGKSDALFQQALEALAGSGRDVIVDEIEHAMRDIRVLEALRDISDLTGTHIIIGGHTGTSAKLRRHAQIYSRISDVTIFGPCTAQEVRTICDGLAQSGKQDELHVEDDLVAEITRRTGGRFRDVKKAIANVERQARRSGLKTIALKDINVDTLTSDGKPNGGRK